MGVNEWLFLLQGLKWTLLLTCVSFAGGGVFGLAIALLRTSPSAPARRVAGAYISVFQGTPLLMQLFVVFYGLALLRIDLAPWISVALAYTAHASAFLGEIWRGAIQALPKGQDEAAYALGLGYVSRLRHVVLPQALKISLPATIGFLVQLLKGTSLAAIVGFVELSRAGQIISNQIFQPLLVFGIIGIVYFLLCWPLSIIGSQIDGKLAARAR